jgi:hypothetical protein
MNCLLSIRAGGARQLSALLSDPCERPLGNADDPGNAADRHTLKHHGRRQVQRHPADRVSRRDSPARLRITVPSGLVAVRPFPMRPGLPTSEYYDDSPLPAPRSATHLSAVVYMSSGEKG